MTEIIRTVITTVFGAGLVGLMLTFIYKRHASDWHVLVEVYGRPWRKPLKKKSFANLVLYSEGRPARGYKGILALGLYPDGIALRPNALLAPFQPPIFVPYDEIRGWDQVWYIDGRSTELTFSRAPGARLIMPREQVEWMLSLDPGAAKISEDRPPHGTRPWLTHSIALGMGALGLFLLVGVLAKTLNLT